MALVSCKEMLNNIQYNFIIKIINSMTNQILDCEQIHVAEKI